MNDSAADLPMSKHLHDMQCYVARVAITPSVFRGQQSGFVRAAKEFLENLDLKPLTNLDASEYPKWLDKQTHALLEKFPTHDRWGHARKSINIFMTMASLNRFLCGAYSLERLEAGGTAFHAADFSFPRL